MNLIVIIKLASAFGHSNIVKLLIDNKADVNVRNNYGNNAVSIGIYLKQFYFNITKLEHFPLTASGYNHLEVVDILISKGADKNNKNGIGWTPVISGIYNA